MLEVGNGGLSLAEERAHFSLWAALKAPLILGFHLGQADAATLGIVSNPEVRSGACERECAHTHVA
jgi:alpha-galactosidase